MSQRKAWAAVAAKTVARPLKSASEALEGVRRPSAGTQTVPGSKYGAVRVGKYASKREAKRAAELKLLERSGAIRDLREQVRFELLPKTDSERSLTYVADFTYWENGAQVVEDCKGFKTPAYKIKRGLMLHFHGIAIRET